MKIDLYKDSKFCKAHIMRVVSVFQNDSFHSKACTELIFSGLVASHTNDIKICVYFIP